MVTIRRLGVNCDVANTWSKHIPFVDRADGTWWIEHAAPEWEVNGEFLLPLRIADTAPSVYAGEASRVFDIEGGTYIEPQDGSPFPDTASWKTEQQVPG